MSRDRERDLGRDLDLLPLECVLDLDLETERCRKILIGESDLERERFFFVPTIITPTPISGSNWRSSRGLVTLSRVGSSSSL